MSKLSKSQQPQGTVTIQEPPTSRGIIKNGEDVTEAALDALASQFKEQRKPEVIVMLREIFRRDDEQAVAIEDALVNWGGVDAPDHEKHSIQATDV